MLSVSISCVSRLNVLFKSSVMQNYYVKFLEKKLDYKLVIPSLTHLAINANEENCC